MNEVAPPSMAPATLGVSLPARLPGHPCPSQLFSLLDHQFARFLTKRSGLPRTESDGFELLSKRLSASLAAGHSCLPVTSDEEQLLSKSNMVSQGLATPLVLWRGRLYLQRYFHYEWRLAGQLRALAEMKIPLADHFCNWRVELDACFGPVALPPSLERATLGQVSEAKRRLRPYPAETGETINWQRRAAEMAMTRPLTLISGGPGTGKTSTVARILGLLLLTINPDFQIALAAPTGKAAMRLRESIAASLATLPFSESIREKIPTTASTLHRLLGVRRHSPHFRHNQSNPLPWDVVMVDEASMVDLALMSKLVDALKPGARLILLGDKDQLASVESGAILADCIQALPDNTVTLQKSYRFNQTISAFARAVNTNDSAAAWAMLSQPPHETDRAVLTLQEPMPDYIFSRYLSYMDQVLALPGNARQAGDIHHLFASLNRFRVLCATRQGADGVETINRQVEQRLAAGGYPCQPGGRPCTIPGSRDTWSLAPSSLTWPSPAAGGWYPGRPVMILSNDYNLNLFNGDIGICLPDPAVPGTFRVWFEREDGNPAGYQPCRLPECETVFAMTIHKSQGSEFAEILVVLPSSDSPLLTRELIYTAVTRAREKAIIASSEEIFHRAISRVISRASGLHEMLMHPG